MRPPGRPLVNSRNLAKAKPENVRRLGAWLGLHLSIFQNHASVCEMVQWAIWMPPRDYTIDTSQATVVPEPTNGD